MIPHGEMRDLLHRYIDGELSGAEQWSYEAHLLKCTECLREYESVRKVVDAVRGSKPLYPAAASLEPKVSRILASARDAARARRFRVAGIVTSFAATVLLFALLPGWRGHHFTSFAADTHSRYSKGSLPLEISSEDAAAVSAWIGSNLRFSLVLPNFPSLPGERKSYSLVGARRVQFEGHEVAYLAYTMQKRPISLLVAPSIDMRPARYDTYQSGRLTFDFSTEDGLKLITWKDHGLSYALISDLEIGGAQSCIICHGSNSERRKFENLLLLNDRSH